MPSRRLPGRGGPPNQPPSESRRFNPEEAATAKTRLQTRLAELRALVPGQPHYVRDANIALDTSRGTVREVFGVDSYESQSFGAALIQAGSSNMTYGPYEDLEALEHDNTQLRAQEAIARLESLLRLVNEKTVGAATAVPSARPMTALSRRIFVVHGHDETVKLKVARTLQQLDLEPIILHEQPDRNRTIIEKIEDFADVGFAVILMTGDDRGGARSVSHEAYKLRARQNVLLEMGFFLGRLGRPHVCVLYEADVELPSDYSGVLYKKLDEGVVWVFELAREIRAAGIDVDFNKL